MKSAFALVAISLAFNLTTAAFSPLHPSSTFIQTPQFDTAIIRENRVGPNFAYSTLQGHAYQAITPILTSDHGHIQIRYQINPLPLQFPNEHHYFVQPRFLHQLVPAQSLEIATETGVKTNNNPRTIEAQFESKSIENNNSME